MSRLKRNILANLSGRAWANILGILFIPLYLKFLGIEAYGLIGFFVTIRSVFGLMDFGLSTTLKREMARLSALEDTAREQRDLLKTLEIIYWSISFLIAVLIMALAPFIAHHWVNPQHLSVNAVENAVRLMGLVMALQFPFFLYQGGLMGLQRQVSVNVILIVGGTLRAVGAVLVLWQVQASIEAFFIWQFLISAVQTGIIGLFLWRSLSGAGASPPRFRSSLLYGVRRFAAGVSVNAVLGVILSQLDKVILIKMLPLKIFGYYALASSVASCLWSIIVPINSALFPRFTQLLERRDEIRLADLYHRACQFMAVVLLPISIAMAFFSKEILMIWTHDPVVVANVHLIATLLIVGNMLDGLISVSAYLQFASGWTQLYMYTNLISTIIFVPLVLFMVGHYGAIGAAVVWVLLNAGAFIFTIPIMHRRLLKNEKWKWYFEDVMLPLGGVLAIVWISRTLMPIYSSMTLTAVYLFGTLVVSLGVSILLAPQVRTLVFNRIKLLTCMRYQF